MPTYRELMDAAANADKAGDSTGAKRLVELASIEQSKSTAPADRQMSVAESNKRFIEREMAKPTTYPTEMGMGGLTSQQEAIQASQTAGSMGARYGGVLLAGAATGGTSIFIPALTGFLGEFGARGIEGKPMLSKEALGEASYSGITSAIPIPAPSAAKSFLGQGMINAAKSGLQTLGIMTAGTQAKSLIEKGKFTPASEVWENAKLPTIMNASLYGMGGFARSMADDLESIQAQRKLLTQIGINNPTAGALIPQKLGELEKNIAATSANVAAQRQGMLSDASESIKGQLAPRVQSSNETVSNMLEFRIGVYDDANARYTKAVTAAEQAQQRALQAETNINISPEELNQIKDTTLIEQYNALSAKASALFDSTIGTGNISNTSLVEKVGGVVSDLFELRRKSASSMTRNLSSMGEFIDVNDLAASAEKALGTQVDTDAGKRIIGAIKSYAKARAEKEPQLFDAAGRAIKTQSPVTINMDQFRELRDGISTALIGSGDDKAINAAERLATKAYVAANDALSQSILALPNGQQLLQEHNAFRSYWASTSKMLESPLGRSLYRKEISDEFIGSLAGKLISANADEVKNLGQFADAISSFDPNVKKVALGSIAEAVKNNLVLKNRKKGVVDWNGIGNDILSMNDVTDMSKFFDVSSIGFGTPKEIKAWTAATKKFKPGDLRSDDILAALESPKFRMAISDGQDTGPILSGMAFNNKVREATLNAVANQGAAAKRSAAEAREYAKKAGFSMEQQRAAFQEIADNPSLSIFRGKGGTNFTKDPVGTTGTISNFIMESRTDDAKRWMDHLKKTNPDGHAIIVENIIGNNLQDFLIPSKTAGQATTVNIKAVKDYLTGTEKGRFEKLSAVIGPEYTNRFNALIKAIPALDDTLMLEGGANTSKLLGNAYSMITGTTRAVSGQTASVRYSEANFAQKFAALIANGAYRTIAKSITNPKSADWILGITRPFADGIAELPVQQSIIMLNDKRLIDEQARLQIKSNQTAPQR
jgi:hypothetical protein